MKPTPSLHFDVIIAGGGFAGVYAAKRLARELPPDVAKRVAIISKENFLVFQPMLAEVVGCSLAPRHVVNPLRRLCKGVTILRAEIHAIDLQKKRLELGAGRYTGTTHASFSHLILALGGIVDLSRVPGMPEHALLMKNVGDALKLRSTILDRFEEANIETDPVRRKRLMTFVVVGGGYSGVETAGQIHDLVVEIVRFYTRLSPDEPRVVLVHSGPHLLPEISESLGRYTETNLEARGLEIILKTRVSAMTASRVMLSDGRAIETHTVISTIGNAPLPLLTEFCSKNGIATEKGRIITDARLRVPGYDFLWTAGDCAAVPMVAKDAPESSAGEGVPDGSSPFKAQTFCPPTAQFALREGDLLGKNIAASLGYRTRLRSFTFTGLGELAAIGHHAAVAEILGFQFHGFFAWWLWRTIYLMKLPGLERKLRVVIDWTLDLFFPRDITLFQSKPTELVKEMHLEPGDILFEEDDPARLLYVLKAGKIELRDLAGTPLREVTPGMQLGKQTLLSTKVWQFNAVAVEPTTLVGISGKVFEAVIHAGATVDEVFAKTLTASPSEKVKAVPANV